MIQFLRIFFLLVLIGVAIIHPKNLEFALAREWQYIISLSILITLVFVDVVSGVIFALVLATIYVRLYDIKLTSGKETSVFDAKELEYITPLHLRKAQSNVVNEEVYKKEYKGIQGVYGEAVYGAQGLDEVKPGYSWSDVVEEED